MKEETNQLKAGAVLSYISLFLGTGISLIYMPYMLRTLGTSEFGLYSLVNSTIAYLLILGFGFESTIVRYTAKFRAEGNFEKERSMHGMFLALYTGIGILAFLLGLILVFNVENLFGKSLTPHELATARVLMMLAVINISLTFPFSLFISIVTAYQRFIFSKSMLVIWNVVNPLMMVVVLTMGYKSIGMIVVTTVLNLTYNGSFMVYCFKVLHIKINFRNFDKLLLKEIIIFSFFIFLGIVIDRLYWNTGQFLLGMLAGTAAVSIFAIAVQLNTYYMMLSSAIANLFLPSITEMCVKDDDSSQLTDVFIRVGRLQFLILAIALSGFILLGKQFVVLWAGADYEASYYIALFLMVPITIPLVQNVGISILQAKNKHAFRAIVYFIIAVFNIGLSIPLIKAYGPLGSAISIAISYTLGQIIIINIYYYKEIKLDIPRFWGEIAKMLPAVLVSTAIQLVFMRLCPMSGIIGFLVNAMSLTILYGICMWLFGLNNYEKALLMGVVAKIKAMVRH